MYLEKHTDLLQDVLVNATISSTAQHQSELSWTSQGYISRESLAGTNNLPATMHVDHCLTCNPPPPPDPKKKKSAPGNVCTQKELGVWHAQSAISISCCLTHTFAKQLMISFAHVLH